MGIGGRTCLSLEKQRNVTEDGGIRTMAVRIESISVEAFRPFGTVLEFPEGFEGNFLIVDTDEQNPWRVAVFRYWNKEIRRIECHPTSKETFEPLEGMTVLLVAEHETPEDYHAFILDKPVCLKKGVWHQTLTLTDEASVKITENLEVESVFYDLREPVSAYLG